MPPLRLRSRPSQLLCYLLRCVSLLLALFRHGVRAWVMSAFLPLYHRKPTFIVRSGMSQRCRYCCKSLKRRSGQFLAKERNERESPINTASNPLRESPVSLARGDLSPHIIIQSPRLRGGEFESHLQKRLLQQYLPKAEATCSAQ